MNAERTSMLAVTALGLAVFALGVSIGAIPVYAAGIVLGVAAGAGLVWVVLVLVDRLSGR